MSKLVATVDLILTPQGIVIPNTGTWTLIYFISQKNFAEGKNVMGGDDMMFTLQGWNAPPYIPGTVRSNGVVSIPKTSVKNLLEHGEFVMRLDDMGSVPMLGTTPLGVVESFVEPWRITDTGQVKCFSK